MFIVTFAAFIVAAGIPMALVTAMGLPREHIQPLVLGTPHPRFAPILTPVANRQRLHTSSLPLNASSSADQQMCRHIINAQVSIFWGEKWFDCHECYAEHEGHSPDLSTLPTRLPMACKSCRQLFHKDLQIFHEKDAHCPHCGVDICIPAMTPKSCFLAEAAQAVDAIFRENLAKPLLLEVKLDASRYDHLIEPVMQSACVNGPRKVLHRRRS